MTHTTTDAAEARALPPQVAPGHWDTPEGYEMALATLNDPHMADARARISDFALANRVFLSPGIANLTDAKERIRWLSARLATAEAASGAGEREDEHGDIATIAYMMGAKAERDRLASLPPATDPAMVDMGGLVDMLSSVTMEEGVAVFEHSAEEIGIEVMEHHRAVLAALAAAPTIPATGEVGALAKMTALDEEIEAQHPGWMTGEAIPKGMKPWHGGDAAPNDLDLSGRVLREDGQTEVGRDVTIQQWKRPVPRCKWNIIAYTPKAAIPAAGHAATEGEGA